MNVSSKELVAIYTASCMEMLMAQQAGKLHINISTS
jgi:hypothetical protein